MIAYKLLLIHLSAYQWLSIWNMKCNSMKLAYDVDDLHISYHFSFLTLVLIFLFLKKLMLYIQGVSKRSLKVRVLITSIFYGAEDLKFCTNKLQNYTIWYIRWEKPKRHLSINKIVFIFLVDFKEKQNLVANFDKKLIFCVKITKLLYY